MAVSSRTRRVVWVRDGGCCAFPGCRRHLVTDLEPGGRGAVIGELAHIVAANANGPRGGGRPPSGEIDGPGNLTLMCPTHHSEIDQIPGTYTVERLVGIQEDHARWVREKLSPEERFAEASAPEKTVVEDVHSTLLPVVAYPRYVWSAMCEKSEAEVRGLLGQAERREIMLPYIVRSRQVFTFYDLSRKGNPFAAAMGKGRAERHRSEEWWSNDDLSRWYVDLLNRSLNKLTGRLGLRLDREHRRYYFEPEKEGEHLRVGYKSLTGRRESRNVVWRPKLRHSGEYRKYWEHLAVGLRFHHLGERAWTLSVRPERRYTRDGLEPITPKGTGRRSTSRKATMYNENVLSEVNFWRDFLSRGRPRIVFNYGQQSLMVSTELLRTAVDWPGVPADARPFTHLRYDEDLFTWAELGEVEAEGESTEENAEENET